MRRRIADISSGAFNIALAVLLLLALLALQASLETEPDAAAMPLEAPAR